MVELQLASGHELGFRGGYHLAESFNTAPVCLLHIGSCVANINSTMTYICSADSMTAYQITGVLKKLGIKPDIPPDPTNAKNCI